MAVPVGYERIGDSTAGAWVRSDLAAIPLRAWEDPAAPALPGARGRAGVRLVTLPDSSGLVAAVRPMRRGGLFGRLLGARYLSGRRVRSELDVHARLSAAGLPVIEPLAAGFRRQGLFRSLWFATRFVEGARPLSDAALDAPALRGALLEAAGRCTARALAEGLDHPDLHPDNFLVTRNGEVLLMDFDRARLGPPDASITERTLLRMARYPFRHAARLGPVRPRDTLRFLAGMEQDRAHRRRTIEVLRPRLLAALQRRGLAQQ